MELCGSIDNPFIAITSRFNLVRVIVPFRVSSIGQIEICTHLLYLKPFNCVQTNDQYQIEILVVHFLF